MIKKDDDLDKKHLLVLSLWTAAPMGFIILLLMVGYAPVEIFVNDKPPHEWLIEASSKFLWYMSATLSFCIIAWAIFRSNKSSTDKKG